MSWQPRIINHQEDKIQRTRREDTTTLEDLKATPNVVVVGKDKFVCSKCNEGWTFARMKKIECCGITYYRD